MMRGKTSPIHHDGQGVFRGLSNPFEATRCAASSSSETFHNPDFIVSTGPTKARSWACAIAPGRCTTSSSTRRVFSPQEGPLLLKNVVEMASRAASAPECDASSLRTVERADQFAPRRHVPVGEVVHLFLAADRVPPLPPHCPAHRRWQSRRRAGLPLRSGFRPRRAPTAWSPAGLFFAFRSRRNRFGRFHGGRLDPSGRNSEVGAAGVPSATGPT